MVWVWLTLRGLDTGCGTPVILAIEEAVWREGAGDFTRVGLGAKWTGLGELVQVGGLQLERNICLPPSFRASMGSPWRHMGSVVQVVP